MKATARKIAAGMAALVVLFSAACNKGDDDRVTNLRVYLTDHPADFEKVILQITAVEAKIDTGAATCRDDRHGTRPERMDHDFDDHRSRRDEFGFWQTLNFTPGAYDVLQLRNGVDTLLATGSFAGTVRKIRITVSGVTVVKGGVSHPVILASETDNFIYVRTHERELERGNEGDKTVIDFDVARSIMERNGQYYLRSRTKPFNDRNFAGLEGKVLPADAKVVITAYNNVDTGTAIPNPGGYYCIRGLEQGTYTLVFDAGNGYIDTTVTNVQVVNGRKTKVADVVLKK